MFIYASIYDIAGKNMVSNSVGMFYDNINLKIFSTWRVPAALIKNQTTSVKYPAKTRVECQADVYTCLTFVYEKQICEKWDQLRLFGGACFI